MGSSRAVAALLIALSGGCGKSNHVEPPPVAPVMVKATGPMPSPPLPVNGPVADLKALAPKPKPEAPKPMVKTTMLAASSCPNSVSCNAPSDCKPTVNVTGPQGVTCTNKCCAITQCVGQWFDVDTWYNDGCECSDDGYGQGCNLTTTQLGTVGQSTSLPNIIGVLPAPNEANWFQVTFGGTVGGGAKPKIVLTSANSNIVFDLQSNGCGGPAWPCGTEGGNATNVTSWDESEQNDGMHHNTVSNNPGTQMIRVHNKTSTPTCDYYTLAISD